MPFEFAFCQCGQKYQKLVPRGDWDQAKVHPRRLRRVWRHELVDGTRGRRACGRCTDTAGR